MTSQRFGQTHPIIVGFLVLGGISLFFVAILTLGISLVLKPQSPLLRMQEGIGVIEVLGPIFSAEQTLQDLATFRNDRNIRAIVLRVDSPGGVVGASQEIFEEVKRTDAVKPVVVSLASVAASGGYYAALGGRYIVANPGTLTGSIGVIMKFANLEKLYTKIGYQSQVLKSGDLKDLGASDRPLTPQEKTILQAVIDDVHTQFIKAVSEGRGLPEEQVRALADGRIFSGAQARDLGLVDLLGNFTDAVEHAAELGGLEGDPKLIYPKEEGFSLLRMVLGNPREDMLFRRFLSGQASLAYEWLSPH